MAIDYVPSWGIPNKTPRGLFLKFNFYFDIISDLQRNYKSGKKFSSILHPPSPNVNSCFILFPLLSLFCSPLSFFLYIVHIYICIYILFFCLNHLRVSCGHDASLPLNSLVSVPDTNITTELATKSGINTINTINNKVNTSIWVTDLISDFANYSNMLYVVKENPFHALHSVLMCL